MRKTSTTNSAINGAISFPPFLEVGGEGLPLKVVRRTVPNGKAEIVLENGDKIPLHPFALVGTKNTVTLGPKKEMSVVLPDGRGTVVVSPAWRMRRSISVFGRKMTVVVKEIETEKEIAGYNALTRHHYRNSAGATRRVPLVAKIQAPDLPEVVGFVEITSCFLVNVARRKILDTPFSDNERGIKWERWDMNTANKFTNVVARISRCVVYPELRGVGIAGVLAEAAKRFAIERWHIGGWRPAFMEITAEMLRYWPFVEKAGFVKVGDTEGNSRIIGKKMAYLMERKHSNGEFPKGGGGILTMYRAHATLLEETRKRRGLSVDKMIARINESPEKLGVDEWVTLHGIYRWPKPVYMLGLTANAENHLRKRLEELSKNTYLDSSKMVCNQAKTEICVENVSVRASCVPDSSLESRRIQGAFGIVAKRSETKIADKLNVKIGPGEIMLITGSSGRGKSLLLRALAWHASGKRKKWALPSNVQSQAVGNSSVKVAMMSRPNPRKSPIVLLKKLGLELTDAMRLLASAGLGEAQLFIRPSGTLSTGQRYRLSLALALAQKPDLLLIDKFCESLDDYSAAAVCRRLRKEVVRSGLAVIAATVGDARITPELRPARVLRLLPNHQHRWEMPT